jgi:hypothetical protein
VTAVPPGAPEPERAGEPAAVADLSAAITGADPPPRRDAGPRPPNAASLLAVVLDPLFQRHRSVMTATLLALFAGALLVALLT